MVSCSFASLNAEQENSQTGDFPATEKSYLIAQYRDVANKRTPSRVHYDVVLIYDDTEIKVYFREDFGLASYQLTNIDTGVIVSDVIDTSSYDSITIPMLITDSNSLDFYIEFEDGSWCHLIWSSL